MAVGSGQCHSKDLMMQEVWSKRSKSLVVTVSTNLILVWQSHISCPFIVYKTEIMLVYLHKNKFHFIFLFTDYVQELMTKVYELREKYPTYREAETLVQKYTENNPENLSVASKKSDFDKESHIQQHISRFNLNQNTGKN